MHRDRYGRICRKPVRGMEEMTGKRFGRLYVERSAGFMRRGALQNSLRLWKCICTSSFGGSEGLALSKARAFFTAWHEVLHVIKAARVTGSHCSPAWINGKG
jgi:hypothetical protein